MTAFKNLLIAAASLATTSVGLFANGDFCLTEGDFCNGPGDCCPGTHCKYAGYHSVCASNDGVHHDQLDNKSCS